MTVFLVTVILVLCLLLWRRYSAGLSLQQNNVLLEHQVTESREAYDRAQDELVRLNRQLTEVASIDPLTELFNRRSGEEVLKAMFNRARRDQQPFALALVDVDDFKQFNEDHGHDLGDQALVALAENLSQSVRPTDKVVRWGGQEFLVLFHQIDGDAAKKVCQRITGNVEGSVEDPLSLITVSVGIAVWRDGVTAVEMLKQADKAVIEAKRQGKDRVVFSVVG